LGFIASVLVLSPAITVLYLAGKDFHVGNLLRSAPYQLLGVALPEEIYFRGFLQEGMGNNLRAVLIVSILFSIVHLPQLIFYGEFMAPLTFFPSLIMGYLYKRTGNILTPTIFHFLANMVFYGFYRT
ncbi:MAG: type II CAAX prenyl endopeptidase Rce1 family protein, partial [Thermodesulfovibrionales bacterium]